MDQCQTGDLMKHLIIDSREHENYLQLDLQYDNPHHFNGIGTHIGSGETFQIIEGEGAGLILIISLILNFI